MPRAISIVHENSSPEEAAREQEEQQQPEREQQEEAVSYQHAARATCSHAPARPSARLSALCPLVHCKMLSVWPSWPGQELMWRTLFRTFAPEPTSSWRSSPSKPGQASSTPTPTLFTYSSLLVLGALGISCTDLRTCSHLPGT